MVWQRFVSNLIDEAAASVILHQFLWHRGLPPVSGKAVDGDPGLLSGELVPFYGARPAPIDISRASTEVAAGQNYSVQNFQFPSSIRGPFERNNTVLGRRWRSRHGNGGLTIVALDGLVQLSTRWARLLAESVTPRGIDVVTMSTPFNHLRTPAGYRPGQLILGGNLEHQLLVARQGVLDLWTVVTSLQAEGRRVGLVGVSHGGYLCLMMSLLADRLEFVTSLVPPVEPLHILADGGTVVRALRRGLGQGPLDVEQMLRVAHAVTPGYWQPQLDPARITLHAARYDRFVPPRRIVALSRRWGTRLVMHDCGHVAASIGRRFIRQVADEICSLPAAARRSASKSAAPE